MYRTALAWSIVLFIGAAIASCDWRIGTSALPAMAPRSPVLDLLPPTPAGCAERDC